MIPRFAVPAFLLGLVVLAAPPLKAQPLTPGSSRAAHAVPALVEPAPDSRLAGDSVQFTWTNNGATVLEWWLYLGRGVGGNDVLDSGPLGPSTALTVPNLPHDGGLLFVRLWYRNPGWSFVDFTIDTWNGPSPFGPAFVSPLPGSDVASSPTLTWSGFGQGVLEWWLSLGSTVGGYNLWDSGSLGTQTSTSIPALPRDGRPVFARLWFRTSSGWQLRDFRFVSGAPSPPVLRLATWGIGFPRSADGSLGITGTVGQLATAVSFGDGFTFFSGFWQP